jgi:hypothetical protein
VVVDVDVVVDGDGDGDGDVVDTRSPAPRSVTPSGRISSFAAPVAHPASAAATNNTFTRLIGIAHLPSVLRTGWRAVPRGEVRPR